MSIPVIATAWLTVPQVAAELQLHPRTVYSLIRQRKLRAAPINARGDFRVRREWIAAYAERCADAK